MAIRNLSNREMLELTSQTLAEHAAAWAANPAFGVVHDQLVALRAELLAIQPVDTKSAEAELSAQGVTLDARHDRLLGGLCRLLDACAELEEDGADGPFTRTRVHLFPEGPRVQRNYAEEAAEGRLVTERVRPEDEALLRGLALPGGHTAHDHFQAWLQACRDLGTLERRRASLDGQEDAQAVRQIDVRNRWIRAVHALEHMVDLTGIPHPFLALVRASEQKADRRARDAAAAEKAAEPVPA